MANLNGRVSYLQRLDDILEDSYSQSVVPAGVHTHLYAYTGRCWLFHPAGHWRQFFRINGHSRIETIRCRRLLASTIQFTFIIICRHLRPALRDYGNQLKSGTNDFFRLAEEIGIVSTHNAPFFSECQSSDLMAL